MEHIKYILALSGILVGIAVLIDFIISDTNNKKSKERIYKLSISIKKVNYLQLAIESYELFLGVFEAFFGTRYWSWHRFIRSIIASTFLLVFLIIAFLPFGHSDSFFGPSLIAIISDSEGYLDAILFIGPIIISNVISDFLSVNQTYFFLKWAKNKSVLVKLITLFFDLLCTTFIYFAVFTIIIAIVYSFPFLESTWFSKETFGESIYEASLVTSGFGLFFVFSSLVNFGGFSAFAYSAYFINLFFYLFILQFVCLKATYKISRPLRDFLKWLAFRKRPFSTFSALVAAISSIIAGIITLIEL